MNKSTERFLARAVRALRDADSALRAGAVASAAGRSYYAMLYAAKALLNERGLRPRSHAAIVAGLETQFEQTGPLGGELQGWFEEARKLRTSAAESEEPTFDETERLLDRARAFVRAAAHLLEGGES